VKGERESAKEDLIFFFFGKNTLCLHDLFTTWQYTPQCTKI